MKRSELTGTTKQYILDTTSTEGDIIRRSRVAAATLDQAVDWIIAIYPNVHVIELAAITVGWCGEWPDNIEDD